MLPFEVEPYNQYVKRVPNSGRHILGYQKDASIFVYQAFNDLIAEFAVENQYFGGQGFSYSRMTWIKTNFLWMMYRSGWAKKENQTRILAIEILKSDFEHILGNAVHSSFSNIYYDNRAEWKLALKSYDVRLQWDPDHAPNEKKQERRAIQLGLKGKTLKLYGNENGMIKSITDITEFVQSQKDSLNKFGKEALKIPKEEIFLPLDTNLIEAIGIEA